VASVERQAENVHQRLAIFAAEQRRLIDIAIKLLAAIRTGDIGVRGMTGSMLTHTLEELRSHNERALPAILTAPSD
jgi:hypothetical protein